MALLICEHDPQTEQFGFVSLRASPNNDGLRANDTSEPNTGTLTTKNHRRAFARNTLALLFCCSDRYYGLFSSFPGSPFSDGSEVTFSSNGIPWIIPRFTVRPSG